MYVHVFLYFYIFCCLVQGDFARGGRFVGNCTIGWQSLVGRNGQDYTGSSKIDQG